MESRTRIIHESRIPIIFTSIVKCSQHTTSYKSISFQDAKHQNIIAIKTKLIINSYRFVEQTNQRLAWEQILGPHCKTVQSTHDLQSLLSIHELSNHQSHQQMS